MITLDRAELATALGYANKAMAAKIRHTLPVLETVRIKALGGGAAIVAATNLEWPITHYIGRITASAASTAGECYCIPYKALAECVKAGGKGAAVVTIESAAPDGAKDPRVKVMCGGRSIELSVIDPHEFPFVPAAKDGVTVASVLMDTAEFGRALDLVRFAACQEDTRPILTAVRLHFNGTAEFAAADGYVLSVAKLDYAGDNCGALLVPFKAAALVSAIVNGKDMAGDTVTVEYNPADGRARFDMGQHVVYVRLIEGDFPNYSVIIPRRAGTDSAVAALVGPWLDFVKSVKKMSTMRLTIEPGARHVSAAVTDDGATIAADLPIVGYAAGPAPLTIALGPALLLGMLTAAKAAGFESMALAMTGPNAPMLADGGARWQFVQMPMHIGR